MENKLIQLFLQIINMSITASYVICVVLLIRFLLKKAPKKYSYALWSVVAFRLCCPVSFQSAFSLFSLKLFDMSKAQSENSATLQYVPHNIGMMKQPEVTVGIPYANSVISGSLPEATPMYSANPMQIWTAVGMYLWCLGISVLVLYSVISYVSLHYRMRTAIKLEGNVYQSDKVCSPFMLGILRPKIYIPFGLDAQTYSYVLTHERYHLKRGDHVIKLMSFLLLILHWFNPLCWLGFTLMSRDMEMSCDEKVLSGAENIRKTYSSTLLSFASNRRFPSPSPLAFGETDVKKRIRNVLRWKKPTLVITVFAVLICGGVLIACAANPKTENKEMLAASSEGQMHGNESYNRKQAYGHHGGESEMYSGDGHLSSIRWLFRLREADLFQTYVSTDCLFMSPLSSYLPMNGDSGYYYLVNDNSFYIVAKSNGALVCGTSLMAWEWQEFPYKEDAWKEMFDFGLGNGVDISHYEERLYLELPDNYHLLKMDEEMWIMRTGSHPNGEVFVWDVYAIEPQQESDKQHAAVQEVNTQKEMALDTAIHKAIMEECKSPYAVAAVECEDHVIIATREYVRYDEEQARTIAAVDVYAMVLYEEYSFRNGGLEAVTGSHIPSVLSFDMTEWGEYLLTDYWIPRDGSYYVEDIKKVFGQVSQEAVDNGLDTQKYIMAQKQRCYEQAVVALDIDVEAVIESLLERIVDKALLSSNAQDYLDASGLAYRELLYYGSYTLAYIENELAEGEQTDLRGECMRILQAELEGMQDAVWR